MALQGGSRRLGAALAPALSACGSTGCLWLRGPEPQWDSAFCAWHSALVRCATGSPRVGPLHPAQRPRSATPGAQSCENTAESWFTASNCISLARMASAPAIGYLVSTQQWHLALSGLALAGISDWADGYVAKKFNQESVLGSYLDPLADKAVLVSVMGALGWSGMLPTHVVAVIVGRDVLLVLGGFYHRANMLGWRLLPLSDFFRTEANGAVPPAPKVKPTILSKVNTVLQLGLVGSCISSEVLAVPSKHIVEGLMAGATTTTVLSGLQYWHMYVKGEILGDASTQAPRRPRT